VTKLTDRKIRYIQVIAVKVLNEACSKVSDVEC
jgi:hypothetical protein